MNFKIFHNKYFAVACRIILGVLFVYASLDKIANLHDFAKIIHNYKLLPVLLENLLAIILPWLEFITGILLITGKYIKGSLLIYSSLLVIFLIALTQAQLRGLDISCGCFSVKPSSTSDVWLRIFLDLIMLYFSINLYIAENKYYEPLIIEAQNTHETENI